MHGVNSIMKVVKFSLSFNSECRQQINLWFLYSKIVCLLQQISPALIIVAYICLHT